MGHGLSAESTGESKSLTFRLSLVTVPSTLPESHLKPCQRLLQWVRCWNSYCGPSLESTTYPRRPLRHVCPVSQAPAYVATWLTYSIISGFSREAGREVLF